MRKYCVHGQVWCVLQWRPRKREVGARGVCQPPSAGSAAQRLGEARRPVLGGCPQVVRPSGGWAAVGWPPFDQLPHAWRSATGRKLVRHPGMQRMHASDAAQVARLSSPPKLVSARTNRSPKPPNPTPNPPHTLANPPLPIPPLSNPPAFLPTFSPLSSSSSARLPTTTTSS